MKLNFCSLVPWAAHLPSYFKDVGSIWQVFGLLASSLSSRVSAGGRGCKPAAVPGGSISLDTAASNTGQQQLWWFPGRIWPSQVWAGFHGAGQGHRMDSRIVPWLDVMPFFFYCKLWTCREDKGWAIVPKVCHPFPSFAQRTLEEEDGEEKVKDPMASRRLRTSHHQR